jgi:hypothetical protein
MKQYVVDELRWGDYEKLKAYLDQTYGEAAVGGIYWVPIETELLAPVQSGHTECQPFYAALELQKDRLSMELLVRTQQRIRCDCIAYATASQRERLIRLVDRMIEQLEIVT